MSEIADNCALMGEDPTAMERRLFRGMYVAVALAVLVSATLAPWRVTSGLLIGGALSLLNHHWLRTSVATAFSATTAGVKPRLKIARYILRYLLIAATIVVAHMLNIASLIAMLIGLCSFVIAAIVEAFMQTYFAIISREEN